MWQSATGKRTLSPGHNLPRHWSTEIGFNFLDTCVLRVLCQFSEVYLYSEGECVETACQNGDAFLPLFS